MLIIQSIEELRPWLIILEMLIRQGDKVAEFVWVSHKSGVEVDVFEAED